MLFRSDGKGLYFQYDTEGMTKIASMSLSGKVKDIVDEFSIGIELEGTDDLEYPPNQYKTLIEATKALMEAYPNISVDNIVGHKDIAPIRKTDPGEAFDWDLYKSSLS